MSKTTDLAAMFLLLPFHYLNGHFEKMSEATGNVSKAIENTDIFR